MGTPAGRIIATSIDADLEVLTRFRGEAGCLRRGYFRTNDETLVGGWPGEVAFGNAARSVKWLKTG